MDKYKKIIFHSSMALWCLRISALFLLLFMLFWIFTDAEFTSVITFNVPLHYSYLYQNKAITMLFLPIIFNLALWCLSYKSYVFICGVLYIELCKTMVIMFFSFLGMVSSIIFIMPDNYFLSAKLSVAYFCFLVYMIIKIKNKKCKKIFCEKSSRKVSIKKTVVLAYITMYGLLIAESFIQPQVISLMADTKQYYIEGQNNIGYVKRLNFSSDGEHILNVFREGVNKGKVGIFDTKTGEKIKILDIKNVNYCAFSSDGQSVILSKDNDDNQTNILFEEWDIKLGKKKKVYCDVENILNNDQMVKFYLDKISFSTDGRYFSATGKGISVWDCQTGRLMKFYDIKSKIKGLEWISAQDYLIVEMSDVNLVDKDEKKKMSIYGEKIENDGKITRIEKEKIVQDFYLKTDGLREINILMKKGIQPEYVAIMISGEPKNGVYYQKGYIDIWNVEEETKMFSLQSNYKILNVAFHPDGKHIVILEELRNQRGRITLWDINQKKKEKDVFIIDSGNVIDIKLIDNGEKLIQLKNPVSIINLR